MPTSTPGKKVKCPSCRKAVAWTDNPYRPFCSERCATLDLGNWADNSYNIEGESVDEQFDESTGE